MSGGLIDKVYIGLDNAPAAFDIKGRILGANGTNLEYIRSETGVVAVLKGDKYEPLHLALHHTRAEALTSARSLALNLIETIRAELAQWSAAQAGGPPPALNVPPPTLATTTVSTPLPVPPPVVTAALSTPTLTNTHPTVVPPVVSVAPAAPLMTVRQPTVLQILPQQQYVLNHESGQLIPIVQPGVQTNSNFTSLPIAQHLGTLQQPNFGTQLVDISGVQPVNVTQLRLSGAPSSMSMILPNGLTLPQGGMTSTDTTTVSSMTTPVVCAAPGAETLQWTMPGSQTMLIPYQQFQDLTSAQAGLANLQSQQFVSIAPAGGLQQTTSLPLTSAQLQQLQATGTIMQLNQKPATSTAPLINIISTGQASSPQIISNSTTPTKITNTQEPRGQKRLSDGTSTQLQLRPIAPAGSNHDKNSARDNRTSGSWAGGAVRENAISMGMKINPTHGTVIHVSSGQQTSVTSSNAVESGSMYIRQLDRNTIQIKDNQKQEMTSKLQTAQNVQMITVPQGMTVLQNPLNIGQMPTVIGQPNSQVYMIPANQSNFQGGLPQSLIGQQVLPSQNVTVMQPNQLVPNSVQYNVPIMPMNMPQNAQYMPAGINLNNQLPQQLTINQPQSLASLPVIQNPNSPIQTPVTQPLQHIVQPNSYVSSMPNTLPPQYVMQPTSTPLQNPVYNIQNQSPITTQSSTEETTTPVNSNQSNYIAPSQPTYTLPSNQNAQAFQTETNQGFATTTNSHTTTNPQPSYSITNQTTQSSGYNSPNSSNQNGQNSFATQQNFSPSSTPPQAPGNYNLSTPQGFVQNQQQAFQGQMYNNQYQYTNRPWFRPPRFGSPQNSPYNGNGVPPPNLPNMPPISAAPTTANYNYWQDS